MEKLLYILWQECRADCQGQQGKKQSKGGPIESYDKHSIEKHEDRRDGSWNYASKQTSDANIVISIPDQNAAARLKALIHQDGASHTSINAEKNSGQYRMCGKVIPARKVY